MIPVVADLVPYAFDLAEIIGILLAWAFIIFAAFRFEPKNLMGFVALFMALTIYKYALKILTAALMEGATLFSGDITNFLKLNLALPALIEFLLLAVMILIVCLVYRKVSAHVEFQREIETRLPDYQFDERALYFPLIKLFDKNNPLQRSLVYVSGLFTLFRIVYLVILDIQIGPPADFTDLLWMIFAYLANLLLGFLAYLFMLYIVMSLDSKDIKMQADL